MSTRPDRPREYFAKLLDQRDEDIDYSEIRATTATDWQDAEVLLPVTPEEFRAIKQFLRSRRRPGGDESLHANSSRR
jgi:hypothetical protein